MIGGLEIPVCACDTRMSPTLVPDVFVCSNCDVTQRIEHTSVVDSENVRIYAERIPTIADQVYNREWNRRAKEAFPGQSNKAIRSVVREEFGW